MGPDFTIKFDLQILYLADFFVFETTNPETIFVMSGENELFDAKLGNISKFSRFVREEYGPNYYKKRIEVPDWFYFIRVRGKVMNHFEMESLRTFWTPRADLGQCTLAISSEEQNIYFCFAYDENCEYFSFGKFQDEKIIKAKFYKRLAVEKKTFKEGGGYVKCLKE